MLDDSKPHKLNTRNIRLYKPSHEKSLIIPWRTQNAFEFWLCWKPWFSFFLFGVANYYKLFNILRALRIFLHLFQLTFFSSDMVNYFFYCFWFLNTCLTNLESYYSFWSRLEICGKNLRFKNWGNHLRVDVWFKFRWRCEKVLYPAKFNFYIISEFLKM